MSAAPFVLVTGGKGGVGKTTLAANLALELARQGVRPLLVDLDLGLANLDVVLRLRAARTLEDALGAGAPLETCVAAGPLGLAVLPAASGSAALAAPDAERRRRLLEGIARLSRGYDLVVADSPAGIGPDVLATAGAAQRVLVVTSPEPAALTDAYGLIKALDAWAREAAVEVPTPEIVVNLAAALDEAERAAEKLQRVCERFLARSPRLAGWLPRAASVRRGAERQEPFALAPRDSLEHGCLRRLAQRLRRSAVPRRPELLLDGVPDPVVRGAVGGLA